jgi:hypothetical protein
MLIVALDRNVVAMGAPLLVAPYGYGNGEVIGRQVLPSYSYEARTEIRDRDW